MSDLNKSILNTIKHKLNLMSDYTPFDEDILLSINSSFARLHQLGVGPDKIYSIVNDGNLWNEFISDERINSVVEYVYLKTQLYFDTTLPSTVIELKKQQLSELEWTLKVASEEIKEENIEGGGD